MPQIKTFRGTLNNIPVQSAPKSIPCTSVWKTTLIYDNLYKKSFIVLQHNQTTYYIYDFANPVSSNHANQMAPQKI
jgi:hypothetical protein